MRKTLVSLAVACSCFLAWAAEPVRKYPGAGAGILYQLAEHAVRRSGAPGSHCFCFSFQRFRDAGYLRPDGSHEVLHLRDHPTAKVDGTTPAAYVYTSTPSGSAKTFPGGISTLDWDAGGQTLWLASFAGRDASALERSSGTTFPGDVAMAPGGRYVVYPLTRRTTARSRRGHRVLFPKFDPFIADSSLVVADLRTKKKVTVLAGSYNRRLFSAFHDFSPDGSAFYTVALDGPGFRFVKVRLATGTVQDFRNLFPQMAWGSVPWNEFFNRGGKDFNFASFHMAPGEDRLVARRNGYARSTAGGCAVPAHHDLWVFALDGPGGGTYRRLPGYVSSVSWKPNGSSFALSTVSKSGCYPAYVDSTIVVRDRNGREVKILLRKPRSKITTIGWSPDGGAIAFDVYGTDFVGHLEVVSVASGAVSDLLDTRKLGIAPNRTHPVTILFASWLAGP